LEVIKKRGVEMKIEYQPIGIVHSPFKEGDKIPFQPSRGKGVSGTVEVFPDFAQGLDDLEGFSHIILLCHFHRSKGYRLKIVPPLDTQLRGLFATRSPRRPNPIGLSVVRLLDIHENELSIMDLDILDGTPVLDIKPYFRDLEAETEVRIGWLEEARKTGKETGHSDEQPVKRKNGVPSGI
jgi:tRNA (adenine37-N6)-methyltransferase